MCCGPLSADDRDVFARPSQNLTTQQGEKVKGPEDNLMFPGDGG